MSKRTKAKKGKLSLVKEIEFHLKELENDIRKGNFGLGRYHTKEIEKDFLIQLERKLKILNEPEDILMELKEKLETLKEKMEDLEI